MVSFLLEVLYCKVKYKAYMQNGSLLLNFSDLEKAPFMMLAMIELPAHENLHKFFLFPGPNWVLRIPKL